MTILTCFSSFYYKPPQSHTFEQLDIPFSKNYTPQKSEKIDVKKGYKEHKVSEELKGQLDEIIDENTYALLINPSSTTRALKEKGFKVLKNVDGARVLIHKNIPQFLIKIFTSASRDFMLDGLFNERRRTIKYTNLLRPFGRKLYNSKNEDPDFQFPEEYLYKTPHGNKNAPLHKRFFAISKKSNVYSKAVTTKKINSLSTDRQIELANKINQFIIKTGIADVHDENFVLDKDATTRDNYVFSILDTEPLAALIEKHDGPEGVLPFEERVILGLLYFRDIYCIYQLKNSTMAKEADKALREHLKNHQFHVSSVYLLQDKMKTSEKILFVIKIIASVILPILPLLILIWATIKVKCCQQPQLPNNNPVLIT